MSPEASITHTRQDGTAEEPVETRMVEIRPYVYVSEDFARQNGMSRHIPPKVKTGLAEPKRKDDEAVTSF